MNRFAILAAVVSAFIAVAPAQAQNVPQLKPTTPWALDYAKDSCRLLRTFGTGEQEVTLGLTAYEPGGRFFISAVGPLTKTFRSPATVHIAMDEVEEYDLPYLQVDFEGRPGILLTAAISPGPFSDDLRQRLRERKPVESFGDPAAEARVRKIGFIDGFEQEFVLETGSLGAPMQALKQCNAELVTHWDIDVPGHEGMSRVAWPVRPAYPWLRARDFPREMRKPTLIVYQLIVDTEGKVAGCHIAGTDEESEFARIACEKLRETVHFDPALGADGRPVRSYFVQWQNLRD